MNEYVSTVEAALRLALSPRQVRNLVRAGELQQLARGVLDATSVARYAAIRRTGRQAWAATTSWAAISLLSDTDAVEIGASQTSRLRGRLRDIGPEGLVERTRARAAVIRYAGHRSSLRRIAPHLVMPDRAALGLAAISGDHLDGYVSAGGAEALVRAHALVPDPEGAITLRVTATDLTVVRKVARHAPVLAALDLGASLDPRERDAATRALRVALDRYPRG